MRLILQNVLKYKQAIFEFPDQKLTLLTGPSGSGKTSLLRAISWCLYGIGKVDPRKIPGQGAPETGVTLEVPGAWIQRLKRPNRLNLRTSELTLVGNEAQEWIYQHYGPLELWSVAGYLTQWDVSPLLSQSNQEKMEVLRTLSFSIPPERYLQVIRDVTQRREQECQYRRGQVNAQQQFLNQQVNQHGVRNEEINQVNQLTSLENELQEIETQLPNLSQRVQIHRQNLASQSTLQRSLSELETQLKGLSQVTPEEVESLGREIESWKTQQPLIERREWIERELARLELSQVTIKEEVNCENLEQELYRAIQLESTREREQAQFRRWGLAYTQESLNQRRKELREVLGKETQWKLFREWQGLKTQLGGLKKPSETVTELQEKIQKLREDLQAKRFSQNVQNCPQCQQPLRILQGRLVTSETPASSLEEINQVERELKESSVKLNQVQMVSDLEKKLNIIEAKLENPEKIEIPNPYPDFVRLRQEALALEELTLSPEPKWPSKLLQDQLKNRQVSEQVKNYRRELNQLPKVKEGSDQKRVTRDQIQVASQKHARLLREINQRETFEKQLRRLRERLTEIKLEPGVEDECRKLEERRGKLIYQINRIKLIRELLTRNQAIRRETEELSYQERKLSSHHRLYDLGRNVECAMIEEVTVTLSLLVNSILSQFFQGPINLVLSPYRIDKQNQLKMTVSLNLIYQGSELNGIRELSGGEGTRVSLALTLALAAIASGPLLMLDESLKGLDPETISIALRAIKEVVGHKTVIVVMHDVSEGWFDQTIRLNGGS